MEKIEDDVKLIFLEVFVVCMDFDIICMWLVYEKIIVDFEQGKIDILIGIQMVFKGFDFDYVSVVGIFNVDMMLNYFDFCLYECVFQLMVQVVGCVG